MSALLDLFGEPRHVQAAAVTVAGGADGAGTAIAVYPGMLAEVSWSKITASDVPSEVQGELASLTIDHLPAPRELTLRRLSRSTGSGQAELEERFTIDAPRFDLAPEVQRFADLCATGGDATPDHERTLATLRVLEAIRTAAAAVG